MLALQLLAVAFLCLSAAFMFGPMLVLYGPRTLPMLARDGQARFVCGFLISATVLTLIAPHFNASLSSGGSAMSLVVADLFTMQFSVV